MFYIAKNNFLHNSFTFFTQTMSKIYKKMIAFEANALYN